MSPETGNTPLDRELARLATRQHGVVALRQLRALGLSDSGVRKRARAGRLHRLHRGVYAVGHRVVPVEGRWMAAVLACGPGSVLSHRSAAALWGLRPSNRGRVDVIPATGAGSRDGIDVHAGATLRPQDITDVGRIPCTTVARTLLDLAEVVDQSAVRRAVERAEILRLFDLVAVEDVLGHAGGRRGLPVLRAALDDLASEQPFTRDELERRFISICGSAGIPPPAVNVPMELPGRDIEADFVWSSHRLIVEVDGYETHGTRRAFERDRERDRELLLAGWRVVRFTWRQVNGRPTEVCGALARLLA